VAHPPAGAPGARGADPTLPGTSGVWKLTLEYDGTDFEGWQAQPDGHRTVQSTLEAALGTLAGDPVAVVGAGRTDAGVHAEGQVASLSWGAGLDGPTLVRAANAHLPRDLAVRAAVAAPAGFHARRDATGKVYRYAIWNGAVRSPLRRRRFHFESRPLDLAAMAAAAGLLVGTHDFASFQAAGSAVTGTVRTLRRLEVGGRAGDEVHVEAEGDGFLRHMVRNLVGTLLEVGRGRRPPESLAKLLEARDRREAGPTAPARGLTLVRVLYEDAPEAGKPPDPEGFRAPAG